MHYDTSLNSIRDAIVNAGKIKSRLMHPSIKNFLSHPIFLAQENLDSWAETAIEIADMLACERSYSAGLPELNKSLDASIPDCFSVDFAIVEDEGQLSIKLIEAQAFPSVMGVMLDFEEIFSPQATLGARDLNDRRQLVNSSITQSLPAANIVMLDQNVLQQATATDFISSQTIVSPRSILDIYSYENKWIHWRDDGAHEVKRCYHRSIFHTLSDVEQEHLLSLLQHPGVSHFNHPAWYYKVDKASLARISHWSLPKTYDIEQAQALNLDDMVLKYPNGYGGNEVFIAPSLEDVSRAPKNSILQERIQYSAFHPTLEGEKKLCVELRYMLLHTKSGYIPVTTLARATYDGNLMRYKKHKQLGEGYTVAVGVCED